MIERKLTIGLITSTKFCEKIKDVWNVRLIESSTAKRIAHWVWLYFETYKKAPGRDIEQIYYSHLKKDKLSKELAEEIAEDILPDLSDEYDRTDFNPDYLLDETLIYFNQRHLALHKDELGILIDQGKVEDAEKLARNFKPLSLVKDSLSPYVLEISEIRDKEIPKPTTLLSPWLKEGQTTIIYAAAGVGKSLLSISVAYMLGVRRYDEKRCEIGKWQVKNPTGCLYIDGEIGEQEMEERVQQFEWLGRQNGKHRMKVLSIPEYQMATEDSFTLASRDNQLKIIQWLRDHPDYKLIVLDSASTLFGLVDENDNSEINNKINPFLRDLRALKVASLLLHHTGKDNKRGLRGASALSAMAHNIFKLSNHTDIDPDAGEAWFVVTKDKQRSAGFGFKSFGLHYIQNQEKTETHWEITKY